MEIRSTETGKLKAQSHSVVLEAKRHLRITGVLEVESFHEDEACIMTQAGSLCIFGSGLHLSRLNPDDGQVLIDGDILSLEYEPPAKERKGLFGKFKG